MSRLPIPDWSLSDLGDETVERIAEEVDAAGDRVARSGDYDRATRLSTGAAIIRDWLEKRYAGAETFPASGSLHDSNGADR